MIHSCCLFEFKDFSPIKHGTFKVEEDHKTVAKLICGNVVTHTSDTPKSEIQMSWTAPEPGSGCVTFRATVIENRDFWYMDEGQLSKDFCEDEENQEDFISNVLEECCACQEAKYEVWNSDHFRITAPRIEFNG